MMHYRTSKKGLSLLQQREGCRLQAYLCSAKVPTIGWGHTKDVKLGDVCTIEQAKQWLREDIAPVENHLNLINERLKRKFRQCEFDALVSFIHQIGIGNFASSTCRKFIVAERPLDQIANEFPKWSYITDRKTGKKVWSTAVENRHISEKNQFLGK